MQERDRLEILKDILFTDDRDHLEKMARRIAVLEASLNDPEGLATRVDPIVLEQLNQFTKRIPETLGPTITATLKAEIRNHKDEVVDALYPVMGKMIKKYVAQEIKVLSEKINSQMGSRAWKRKFRAWFGNVKEEELLLSESGTAQIEQVFLIEKDSGILKAAYARNRTIDEEMISGMLTAIKAFVEEAFQQRNQDLELVEYEFYHIHLQSFVTHYLAVVISGNYTTKSKNKVQDLIFDFYNRFMAMNLDLVFETSHGQRKPKPVNRNILEKKLAKSFGNASI